MKKAFLLKNNWIEIFDNLSDKQAGVLIKTLFAYNVNGDKPTNLTDVEVKAYFNVMLLDCIAMNEGYDRRCETSADNGKLGGRPKKPYVEKPKKPNEKPKKPNILSKANNDLVFEREKEEEKESTKEKEEEKEKTPLRLLSETYPLPVKSDEDILFENFQKWLDKNAPNVQRLKEPFTKEQYLRLRKEFDKDTLTNTILQMHNWKPLTRNNTSANLTFRKWVAKDRG